jgi:hypothetical protein
MSSSLLNSKRADSSLVSKDFTMTKVSSSLFPSTFLAFAKKTSPNSPWPAKMEGIIY